MSRLPLFQQRLWEAADKFESDQISGAAYGLVVVGVMKGLPRAMAIALWQKELWAEYYRRKDLLPTRNETPYELFDFSRFRPIPHSIRELNEEVFQSQ